MVTVKQLVAITTGRSQPPYHVSDLRTRFNIKPLSLRSVRDGVDSQKVVIFVSIRDVSILEGVRTLDELAAKFRSSAPSRTTLFALLRILNSTGASVKFLAKNWQRAAISGTVASFVGLSTIRIRAENLEELGHSLAIVGGGVIVIGAEFGQPWLVVGGVGLVGAGGGLLFGDFLSNVLFEPEASTGGVVTIPEVTISDDTGKVITAPEVNISPDGVITIGGVTIYGDIPSGENPAGLVSSPSVDETTIPSVPPEPPDAGPPDPGGTTPGVPDAPGGP